MINKRLLIKNLLAHNDECSFYDKKLKIDLGSKEGKAKFLKHICALSNSNPKNNSYIVIGIEDSTNEIVGVDFFDDSKIQNLVNAYLDHPPLISYENIPFPHLKEGKVVGLVTIRPIDKITSLRKNIWKYWGGTVFFREGSISMPKVFDCELKDVNSRIVEAIETKAKNNIEHTLDGVMDFIVHRHKDLQPSYKVFKELFVVCWAGLAKKAGDNIYYSRVDIELINEQVRLFYSAKDEVTIEFDEGSFKITEYVQLGLNTESLYHPLEELTIFFNENGFYSIDTRLLFVPPRFDKKTLYHIYNSSNALVSKLKKNIALDERELKDLKRLPANYLICFLNDFSEAKDKLIDARPLLKEADPAVYESYKEAVRIIRKVNYN